MGNTGHDKMNHHDELMPKEKFLCFLALFLLCGPLACGR